MSITAYFFGVFLLNPMFESTWRPFIFDSEPDHEGIFGPD